MTLVQSVDPSSTFGFDSDDVNDATDAGRDKRDLKYESKQGMK